MKNSAGRGGAYPPRPQAAVDTIKEVLIDEVGLTDEDFREVPAMFIEGSGGSSAYFPMIQNLLVAGDVMFLANPEGPVVEGVDIWQQSSMDALAGLGYTIHFVDVYDSYHLLLGGVHCGINVEHSGAADAWWKIEMSPPSHIQVEHP